METYNYQIVDNNMSIHGIYTSKTMALEAIKSLLRLFENNHTCVFYNIHRIPFTNTPVAYHFHKSFEVAVTWDDILLHINWC